MTKEQFNEFINEHDLYYFDGLIEITHTNGTVHKGIWITSTPPLDESFDGKFAGKAEHEVFYLFERDAYVVWFVDEILALKCLREGYLKGIPYQLEQ